VTNHRLRGAMLNAGLTPIALAAAVEVDVKSVMRWIAEERMPYRVTRVRVAHVLHQEETFLWPTPLQDGQSCAVAAAEVERVWPTRSSISSETWHALFSKATKQLDILVYAGAFLIETLDLADVLEWKLSKGTSIRVLVGDPRSEAVITRAAELSLEWLPQRCKTTLDSLQRVDGIGLRPHGACHYVSLFRFDELLLVNTPRLRHLGVPLASAPAPQGELGQPLRLPYASSFDNAWRRWSPAPRQPPDREASPVLTPSTERAQT
jgi:hypothetical protein